MSTYSDQDYDQDGVYDDDYLEEQEDEESNDAARGVGAWGASVILHAAILAILAVIVAVSAMVEEKVPLQTPPADLATPPPPEEKVRELKEVEVTVEAEVTDANSPIVTDLELEVTELETEDEVEAENPVKGREEAVAASETGGSGAFMAMGAGGGSAGAFGSRSGGGRKRAVGRYGGNRASESAVEAALRWFARHQSPNGMWDVDGYPINCTVAGAKCEPGGNHTNPGADAAMTGYALLCYLGAGYDHKRPSKWRTVVKKGIEYLSANHQDGSYGRNYEQGIVSMALCEAFGMTGDLELRPVAQAALDVMISRQNGGDDSYRGGGWDYVNATGRNDMSVTGWCVMALKSAKIAGLDVGNSMSKAKGLFERAWTAANKEAGLNPTDHYNDISVFPYSYFDEADLAARLGWEMKQGGNGQALKIKPGNLTMTNGSRTAVGLCLGVFLGHGSGDIMMETLANEAMKTHLPTYTSFDSTNQYWMYYNTLAVFQVGGARWKEWNDTVRDVLVNAQKKTEDCFDGSWDYALPGNHYHGYDVGRLLSTAYCCLSLEVYYRYQPMKKGGR